MSKTRQLSDAINSVDISQSAPDDAVTLDASGNLLVGKTASDVSTEGVELRPNLLVAVRDNGNPAYFRRNFSDGEIANFLKGGTKVGSIGTLGDDATIGTGIAGFRFRDSAPEISPHDITANAVSDGLIDLGAGARRFKDLYLSGGVYLGGTGSANKLDDYEEGAWTMAIQNGFSSPSYDYNTGNYIKIGTMVMAWGRLGVNGGTANGSILRVSLPFTVDNNNADYPVASVYSNSAVSNAENLTAYGNLGLASMDFIYTTSTSSIAFTGSDFGTSGELNFTLMYQST